MAVEVLELAPFVIIFVVGAWLVLTGRKLFSALTGGLREGSQARLVGLVYCAASAFFIYHLLTTSFILEALIPVYSALAIGAWVSIRRRRTDRTRNA